MGWPLPFPCLPFREKEGRRRQRGPDRSPATANIPRPPSWRRVGRWTTPLVPAAQPPLFFLSFADE